MHDARAPEAVRRLREQLVQFCADTNLQIQGLEAHLRDMRRVDWHDARVLASLERVERAYLTICRALDELHPEETSRLESLAAALRGDTKRR